MTIDDRFDTHCHLFERGFRGGQRVSFPGHDEELSAYERLRMQFRIRRSLVVGFDEKEYAGNSDYIEGLAQHRSWMTPLRYVAAGEPLAPLMAAYPLSVAESERLAHDLADAHHLGHAPQMLSLNVRSDVLQPLAATLAALESTWVGISHLGLPGPVSGQAHAHERLWPILQLAGCANVSVKLSGEYAASRTGYPHRDVEPLVETLADVMGIDALVWGSDFAPCLGAVSFQEAVECSLPAGINETERSAIYSANAQRMFRTFIGGSI